MKFISLGQGCLAAFHLRAYGLKSPETQFFDWIVASQKTVFEVFSMTEKDIRTALSTDIEFEDELFEGHKAFRCKRFDLLRSVHDLPPNGDRPDLFKTYFVDKYVRRYVRLVEQLNDNANEPVVFVMTIRTYHEAEHAETLRLMDLWDTRFPSLRYHLVVFVECESKTVAADPRLTLVRIQDYLLPDPPSVVQWYLNQYDWRRMLVDMVTKLGRSDHNEDK